MSKQEVLQHYEEVTASEMAWLNEHTESLAEQLKPGCLRNALLAANFSATPITRSKPRPSLRLLGHAFYDLSDLHDIKNPEPRAIDATTEALAGVLEEYVLPLSGLAIGGAEMEAFVDRSWGEGGLCRLAEFSFHEAFQQIGHPTPSQQKNVAIYHTADGQPIALQKHYDARTALTLEGMLLAGKPIIPAGTIIKPLGGAAASQTGEFITPHCTFTTHVAKEPVPLIPGRMSAWAYPEALDRCLFAVINNGGPLGYDAERVTMLTGTTLDDFRRAAHRVMDMCEVELPMPILAGSAIVGSTD